MDSWIFPVFLLWATGCVVLLFRYQLDWVFRLSALLILVFYGVFFKEDIWKSYNAYITNPREEIFRFLPIIGEWIPTMLFFFWPIAIWIIARSSPPNFGRKFLRNLVLITLFYWVFYFATTYFNFQAIPWLNQNLPKKIELPSLPKPPS